MNCILLAKIEKFLSLLLTFCKKCRIIGGMKTYHYIIKGRVQGVAFRYYAVHMARDYRIRGTVKNLWNGDVEVYAQGEPEDLVRFEAFLQSGPPSAQVTRVIKQEANESPDFPDFDVVY
jgi:acylphosphatase